MSPVPFADISTTTRAVLPHDTHVQERRIATPSLFRRLLEHLQYLRLVAAGHGPAIVPIHNLSTVSLDVSASGINTYNGPLEAFLVLFELLQGVCRGGCTLDDRRDCRASNIIQDVLELVRGRRILGDVVVELGSRGSALCRVITGLVLRRSLGGIGRYLLQESRYPDRRRHAGLVEEGDDVLGLVLYFEVCQLAEDSIGPSGFCF